MGRGDRKTAKGKRTKGSFGNSRPSRPVTAKKNMNTSAKKED